MQTKFLTFSPDTAGKFFAFISVVFLNDNIDWGKRIRLKLLGFKCTLSDEGVTPVALET